LQRLEAAGLVRHKEPYWAATDDDRVVAATAAFVGIEAIGSAFSDDRYTRTEGWDADLPDLSDEER
jgi:hypothetical protein